MHLRKVSSLIYLCVWWCLTEAKAHTCERECEWPPQPRMCEYNFEIEWYYTMSKACHRCPFVVGDCRRPHCVPADGVQRPFIAVNSMLHGPVIRVCHNDTVRVTFRNHLDNYEAISIHWHGLFMKDTRYKDGFPMLTQCPIPAKSDFTYEFRADPPGTHWWHAHSTMQRLDGLAGAFIVDVTRKHNPHAHLYDIDDKKYTVFVADWFHQLTLFKLLDHYYSSGDGEAEGILINGKGAFKSFHNRDNDVYYHTPYEVFYVRKGRRYRFRALYNGGVNCSCEISIDDHEITIIALDGSDIIPCVVTSLVVYGDERYDFIINAKKKVSSYWLRVRGIASCRKKSQKAILRYVGAKNSEPSTVYLSSEDKGFKQLNIWEQEENQNYVQITSLQPLHPTVYPKDMTEAKPDVVYFIGFDLKNNTNQIYINKYLLSTASVERRVAAQLKNDTDDPMLKQSESYDEIALCDLNLPSWYLDFSTCPYVIDIEIGHLVELVIYGQGISNLLMHLHGPRFAVVAVDRVTESMSGKLMREIYMNDSIKYILDPIAKDTVVVQADGYIILRFVAGSPDVSLFGSQVLVYKRSGTEVIFMVSKPHGWPKLHYVLPTCGDWSTVEGNGGPGNIGKAIFSTIFILITGSLALIIKYFV